MPSVVATAAKARREDREVEDRLGIARQGAACRAEIERHGWTVDPAKIYRDNDVSASSGKLRPAYTALMRIGDVGQGGRPEVPEVGLGGLLRRGA